MRTGRLRRSLKVEVAIQGDRINIRVLGVFYLKYVEAMQGFVAAVLSEEKPKLRTELAQVTRQYVRRGFAS